VQRFSVTCERDIDQDCERLASNIVRSVPLPEKADVDALHRAVAVLNGID
jgi:hypothetical protein